MASGVVVVWFVVEWMYDAGGRGWWEGLWGPCGGCWRMEVGSVDGRIL